MEPLSICAMVSHLVLGAWLGYTLAGHSAYQQFSHNHIGFCECLSVAAWGAHIDLVYFLIVYNCKSCGPHSQATAPPLWNVQELEVFIDFLGFVLPHTTN